MRTWLIWMNEWSNFIILISWSVSCLFIFLFLKKSGCMIPCISRRRSVVSVDSNWSFHFCRFRNIEQLHEKKIVHFLKKKEQKWNQSCWEQRKPLSMFCMGMRLSYKKTQKDQNSCHHQTMTLPIHRHDHWPIMTDHVGFGEVQPKMWPKTQANHKFSQKLP